MPRKKTKKNPHHIILILRRACAALKNNKADSFRILNAESEALKKKAHMTKSSLTGDIVMFCKITPMRERERERERERI